MGGGIFLIILYFVVPGLLAGLLVWGAWKFVLQGFALWYFLLFFFFYVLGGFNFESFAHGALLYGMFFSIIAVPIFSLLLKWAARFRQWRVAGSA